MGDLFTICTGHWLLNSPHRSILGHSEEERSRAITSSNSNLRLGRHANRHQVHTQTAADSDTSPRVCSILCKVSLSSVHEYVWPGVVLHVGPSAHSLYWHVYSVGFRPQWVQNDSKHFLFFNIQCRQLVNQLHNERNMQKVGVLNFNFLPTLTSQ